MYNTAKSGEKCAYEAPKCTVHVIEAESSILSSSISGSGEDMDESNGSLGY